MTTINNNQKAGKKDCSKRTPTQLTFSSPLIDTGLPSSTPKKQPLNTTRDKYFSEDYYSNYEKTKVVPSILRNTRSSLSPQSHFTTKPEKRIFIESNRSLKKRRKRLKEQFSSSSSTKINSFICAAEPFTIDKKRISNRLSQSSGFGASPVYRRRLKSMQNNADNTSLQIDQDSLSKNLSMSSEDEMDENVDNKYSNRHLNRRFNSIDTNQSCYDDSNCGTVPSQRSHSFSRTLSSPEELMLLGIPGAESKSGSFVTLSTNASTFSPSLAPNGDFSTSSTIPFLMQLSPVSTPIPMLQQITSKASNYALSSNSAENLSAKNGNKQNLSTLQFPQVQLNGSILSIGNAQLMESANKFMEQYAQRRLSVSSAHSDTRRNLLLLQNVGRTIQRTHNHLKKTRLLHAFYLFALPIYTLFGAFVFQALDGAQDDHLMKIYDLRCREEREHRLSQIEEQCKKNVPEICFGEMNLLLTQVETCYRRWHEVNKTMTHPMSDFTNAVIYAFSVYTTIGYGTISAGTMAARIATVIYGAFGIPLFFAFIKEEGNQCRMCFIWLYNWIKRLRRSKKFKFSAKQKIKSPPNSTRSLPNTLGTRKESMGGTSKENLTSLLDKKSSSAIILERETSASINESLMEKGNLEVAEVKSDCCGENNEAENLTFTGEAAEINNVLTDTNYSQKNNMSASASAFAHSMRQKSAIEQRRVFISGVIVFIVYLLAVSALFSFMADWDFFTAFYFLFNSVALIGFGDVFPSQASIILVNMFFIVLGVVLFSMCYFILQEEIRVKAFEASRKARMSISKYSHSLMLHTKNPWSRRNSPAFDRSAYSEGGTEGGGFPGSTFDGMFNNGTAGNGSTFERLRKRRQSAPVITLNGVSQRSSKAEVLLS